MDIVFTAVGLVLVLAVWPALLLYAWNDPMLRHPRSATLRRRRPRRRLTARPFGASGATTGVPAGR